MGAMRTNDSPARPDAVELQHSGVAYGLLFRSALPLPFRPAPPDCGAPDVVVRFGRVPEIADAPAATPCPPWCATPDAFSLDMDGVARYLVRGGCEIVVEPAGGDEADMLAFLLGTVLAACLQQRGILTLHASAVETAGGAALFAGVSAAGKSTLAAALVERGHRLLADDVTGVTLVGGEPHAQPAFPRLRLWAGALESLGWRAGANARVRECLEKFILPVNRFATSALRVRTVFDLRTHNRDTIETEVMPPATAFEMLLCRTYRMRHVAAMQRSQEHFAAVTALARGASTVRIVRPAAGPPRFDALVEALDPYLNAEGPAGTARA